MGTLKKKGDWVDADAYRLSGRMSNYELDLREYEGVSGFRLFLEVDLDMSTLRLIVPDGWVVSCNLDSNIASNVKDKGPSAPWGDNRIEIAGGLKMSTIKVKYK